MDDLLVEHVLRAVEQIPPGAIVSYGDVAELVGTGPRQVGAIMSRWGSTVAWWRVTNAAGRLPAELLARALPHWAAEGVSLSTHRQGCRIIAHRADLRQLAADYARATADLAPGADTQGAGAPPGAHTAYPTYRHTAG